MKSILPPLETKSRFQYRAWLALVMTSSLLTSLRAAESETPSYLPAKEDVLQLEKFSVRATRDTVNYAIERGRTATKTDTVLLNVPQAITVVTRELINDQAMQSIGDVTRYVPGVGIAQGEGNRDTPVLRGNSTTADFFIDGVRDDVQYYRDLYNVDRVEVLKGPNAMIFGRGSSGGLINRVTKQAMGTSLGEITALVGAWDQYRATVDYAQPLNDQVSFRVTGLYEDAGSYRDDVTLERHGLNPTLLWKLSERTTLRTGYEFFHDNRTADRGVSSYQGRPVATASSTFFGNPDESYAEARVHTAFASLDHQFSPTLNLRNHTRYSYYDKVYQNVFPGAVNTAGTDVSLSAYRNATFRQNWFNQTDLVASFSTGPVQHQWLTGLELGRQETDNLRKTGYFTTVSPSTTSVLVPLTNPRTTLPLTFLPSATDASNDGVARSVALYTQDQITLLPQLQAIAGVRWEQFTMDFLNRRTNTRLESRDSLVSPRAGLIYKPTEALSLYTSYSTSYVPRAGEQLSSLSLTNSNLDPEDFTNYEIGLKWNLRPDLALTVATYRLERHHVAITDPSDPTKSLLVDGQRTEGVELGLTGRLGKNWSIAGGYAYQDGRILTTQSATVIAGSRLAQLPRHTFSLWNRYDLNRRWGFGVGTIYRDEIYASTDNTVKIPSFVRFDTAVFLRVNAQWRAQLNIENVLDRDYYASAHSNTNLMPGSPRAWRLSLTRSF